MDTFTATPLPERDLSARTGLRNNQQRLCETVMEDTGPFAPFYETLQGLFLFLFLFQIDPRATRIYTKITDVILLYVYY